MQPNIDYTPLATFSKLFVFFRTLRRVRMVAVRVVLVGGLIALIAWMIWLYGAAMETVSQVPDESSSEQSFSFSYRSSGESDPIGVIIWLVIVAGIAQSILTIIMMGAAWDKFAAVNGFRVMDTTDSLAFQKATTVPSFEGKWLKRAMSPIIGRYGNHTFSLFSRQYKEGGLLRWRERQMDTIVVLEVPANLPHMVINARGNERARRSNLSKSFPQENKFQFEGAMGSRYDVYAKPESRVTALQLFTPDVLQVLYDKLPSADVELFGDKLWIVQRYGVLDDKLARTMLEAGDALYSELEKQLRVAGLLQADPQTSVQ